MDPLIPDSLVDRILSSWKKNNCLPIDVINGLEELPAALISPLKTLLATKVSKY